jgi:phosphate/sulfate permease
MQKPVDGQIGTAALVSLAHGTHDAQKTMGVITLAQATARLGRARREGHTGEVVSSVLMIGVAALVCAAALVIGFIAMTHKS